MIFDLSSRSKFQLSGADRVRYLNGQVTQDTRKANSQNRLYACVTDAKGYIFADVYFHATSDLLILDAEPDQREPLAARLERYIIADDVELSDVTDAYQLWHLCGESALPLVDHPAALAVDRLGQPGVDLWLPLGSLLPFDPVLAQPHGSFEQQCILHGIPRMPAELHSDVFPPEAGLEAIAISYTKGCYIGQEILSRIRTSGKMPQRLVRLSSPGQLLSGMSLHLPAQPERAIGTITSASASPQGGSVALAYVRQAHAEAHSQLLARSELSSLDHTVLISSLVNR
jgi:tRNA-modifying protein YgfZ